MEPENLGSCPSSDSLRCLISVSLGDQFLELKDRGNASFIELMPE